MHTIGTTTEIDAPVEAVWAALRAGPLPGLESGHPPRRQESFAGVLVPFRRRGLGTRIHRRMSAMGAALKERGEAVAPERG